MKVISDSQLDLLYEIYKLRKRKDKLRKKYAFLKKTSNVKSEDKMSVKFQANIEVAKETNEEIDKLSKQIDNERNVFAVVKEIEKYQTYINNIQKSVLKSEIGQKEYVKLKNEYDTELSYHTGNLRRLQDKAKVYYAKLLDDIREQDDKIVIAKLKKRNGEFSKDNYKKCFTDVEAEKTRILKLLTFLRKEILSVKP